MKIGNIDIGKRCALAPMAGVTDRAFREICKEFGAGYVISEMASSKGLLFKSAKTETLLSIDDGERPMALQIFGDDPLDMANAAKYIMKFKPDIIDINMGCPAPKIVNGGSGSSLMKNPKLAGEIVRAVSGSVPVPVTVKFRKGWDDNSVNALEFAKIVEENGANAICIHGRTREQMYSGKADLDIIKAVCDNANIPVIANGDVVDVKSYKNMMEYTGCDLVMIGRGALGNPWVFKEINHYNETGEILPPPTAEEKLEVLKHHAKLICQYKTERIGMKEARKHAGWYFKDIRGAAKLRKMSGELVTYDDLLRLCEIALSMEE
ncbi:MAG: tRNA dihydrouridine synthase DusB [Oscillospiraceae bacterium]